MNAPMSVSIITLEGPRKSPNLFSIFPREIIVKFLCNKT